ncbi:glycosyltransferase family 4 protein [Pedobacter faecalis]|uniref:glycosyltransferase family 4 protein n=1 Tax=Pedobacter faecalis TaxID=3041495 RepID=UPI00254D3306|nr:glycosyltransferase family 4 protein [Pedobacter sp. ELA7]
MKIFVTGTRGIPNILGGVETHCEELYPLIAEEFNCEITVILRSSYIVKTELRTYRGVKLKSIYAPRSKMFEAIIHSFLAVLWAAICRPDVLHIHAVGPNLMAPLARIFGLKVVMTHHGPDYERAKWSKAAKLFLKLGEWAGVKFANRVIVISEEIKKSLVDKYGRADSILIPNGVSITGKPVVRYEILKKFDLEKRSYIFTLGRFVPEKGFDYLIRAYKKTGLSRKYKLVIAGDADHETSYSQELKKQGEVAGVVFVGFRKGEELAQLFSNCRLFVLPSFYEGLPISLLEAMAYGLQILASDIPANLQVNMPSENYYPVGDETVLAQKLVEILENSVVEDKTYDLRPYDWRVIAKSTFEVFKTLK